MNEFEQFALEAAERSPCEKRKVGACIVEADMMDKQFWTGWNHDPNNADAVCEDAEGSTLPNVLHAEVHALNKFAEFLLESQSSKEFWIMYVTYQPCIHCQRAIAIIQKQFNIRIGISVVEQFMKFDSGKLAFDLVPSVWEKYDAEVLTKGAQKYKANNWKEIDPKEILRYYAAARRHMLAWLEFMEGKEDSSLFDDGELGIGTHHLANARTNLGFLLTLTETLEKAKEIKNGHD